MYHHIHEEMTALRAHRFLLRAAQSLAGVFVWVLLVAYFNSIFLGVPRAIAGAALVYGLIQFISIILTPFCATYLRFGARRTLIWGTLLLAAAYSSLGAMMAGLFSIMIGAGIFALMMGVYRALYWIPYALEKEELPYTKLSWFVVYEIVIALLPAVAGITIATMPFPERIFFGSSALAALSILPALFLPEFVEQFSWSYGYTFAQVFRRKNHLLVMHSFLEGFEGAALFLVWPLAAFIILGFSYQWLGVAIAASMLVVLVVRGVYRHYTKRFGLHESTLLHSVVILGGWVGRAAAASPVGVIIADVFAYTALPPRRSWLDERAFEHAADGGTFVDEYTALKEISLAVGRLCCAIMLGVFVFFAPAEVVLAGIMLGAALAGVVSTIASKHI